MPIFGNYYPLHPKIRLLGKLPRIKFFVERQKYSSKSKMHLCLKFYCVFFHLFLNNLNTKSVCYVSKYGYVSWCIVWNEVSKSVQKDKKLFVIQIAHEAHPFMKLMTHLPPTTPPLSWSHLPPNPTPFMSLPPLNPTPFMKPIPLMKLIPLKNTAFLVSVKNEALEKWLWTQQIQVK